MFHTSFTKTAEPEEAPVPYKAFERCQEREDEAWKTVQHLLSILGLSPKKSDEFKVGDVVFYNGETGWKYGEDARHTKGNWADADWDKDGIALGEQGVVTKIDKNDVWVNWDKHHYKDHSKKWTGSYRPYELKKDPKTFEKSDWEKKHHAERMSGLEKVAVSSDWVRKHTLSGLNKRMSKYRGLDHPKAMAKEFSEQVSHSEHAREDIHHLGGLFKKRKAAKDVY